MLNNGTAVSGDSFWDWVFGNNCAEGEEEVFRLFADCQTHLSRFLVRAFTADVQKSIIVE